MDAFRSLLSKPREGGSSRSGAVLGRAPPKRGWGTKPKPGSKKEPEKDRAAEESSGPTFAPRSQARKVQEPRYKDRAAIRRAGGDGEYKEVEHLLEEFERRKAEAGDDADKVEAQREYLGGDAEHSVLVKGLDYALLARRKAEIESETAAGMEDELEQLGQGIKGKDSDKENAVEVNKEKKKGNKFKSIGKEEAAPVEKSRKKSKAAAREVVREDKVGQPAPRARSPVKPPPPPNPEDEDDIFADAGEYDLKAGREDEEDDSDDDDSDEEGQMDVDEPRGRSRSRSRSRHVLGPADIANALTGITRNVRDMVTASATEEATTTTIMTGGVSAAGTAKTATTGMTAAGGTTMEADTGKTEITTGTVVGADWVEHTSAGTDPSQPRARDRPGIGIGAIDDEGPVTRLQPLASSAITDLRGFLDADEAGSKADAMRASKARWRAAQGLAVQEGVDMSALQRNASDKQKSNREYQVLMNRLNKDKDKDGGPSK
ncbi:uncharacterized protein CcaverHIS019_0202880 [Cutaneotrichosporon cavernicola]|uniref:RED-like N-terminal domain-containing protein n=1 Tax=Cutaneotrichosporon cavernicola TaxID=279322 RepID=A0AA48KZR6_9TREE|nr:uncharacterized protein CcaverHIS019_0202880 [Cutaneotrichosporon cavernicola]BEI88926.1 hypothetical protein CcaverHIS019_0202880 [Cutaneotrichosporon cavernicola]